MSNTTVFMLAGFALALPLAAGAAEKPVGGGKETAREVMTFGTGSFKAPETVVWDKRNDVYLVSNINGKLTARDDNGFISRVSPDGNIEKLKWIDGKSGPQVVLHAPKDMLLTDEHLIVADMGAVRYFERDTGKPVRAVLLPDAEMPNALAPNDDGTLYVTDTGGSTDERPGAIYEIPAQGEPKRIAEGARLDRPNGVVWERGALVVAPFDQHADTLYRIAPDGKRRETASVPQGQLDGLLQLPDGSLVVTSWQGDAVYRVRDGKAELIADGIRAPAQIGYDAKRGRLLVPSPREHRVHVYALDTDS